MGAPEKYMLVLKQLHHQTPSEFRANDQLLTPFVIFSGAWQGCPLSAFPEFIRALFMVYWTEGFFT